VHVALLVVRGQLDVERDRLVREANELGSVVLGEELADVLETDSQAGTEADQHQAIDRIGVVETLAADPTGLGKEAGGFVIPDG